MPTLEEKKNILSPDQVTEYYKTQSSASNPLSPTEYATRNPIIVSPQKAEGAIDKANETKANLTPEIEETKTEAKVEEKPQEKTGGGYSFDEAIELFGQDFTGLQKLDDGTFEADSSALSRLGIKTDTDEIDKQTKDIENAKTVVSDLTTKLQNLDISKDPSFMALSNGIQNTWNERISEMENANKSRQASLSKTGIRLGSRFVSLGSSFEGVISTEETQGIQRVASLEAQKQQALANAEIAFRSKRFDEYVTQIQIAEEHYANEVAELNALNDIAIAKNEALETETSKGLVDDAVYNVLSEGITDTASVYAKLRNQGIDTTADDVKKIISSFMPEPSPKTAGVSNIFEFSKDNASKLVASGMSGEDIQASQDVINKYGLYGAVPELDGQSLAEFVGDKQLKAIKDILYPKKETGATPEVGDYKTNILIPRIGKQIYGTRISDLETKRVEGFVTQGMSMGKTQYEIIDDVLGYQVERNKPLADGLRNTLLATVGENGLFGFDMLGLARLINMGEDLTAVRKVENSKMLEAKDMVGIENFVAEADVDYINNKVQDIRDLLGVGLANEVGAFTGTFNQFLSRKLGFGQSVKIKAKITAIVADMVNKRAGSAITETEWERIVAPNVPAMNDSAKAFNDKLTELVGDTLERYNSERKMVALPSLSTGHITNPETRVGLYGAEEDPNPLNIQTTQTDPMGLGI